MDKEMRRYVVLSVVLWISLRASTVYSGIHGFVEGGYGMKLGDERGVKNAYNLSELRFQLKGLYFPNSLEALSGEVSLKGEALLDGYSEEVSFYFRELNLAITPFDSMDVKIGRQILTWGTGDLLFINDLFPKDYVSFFVGRDDEYLKLPSDALRVWFFTDHVNLDMVLIPFFEPDESIRGTRLSFYDGLRGMIRGREARRVFVEPKRSLENAELALRVYRTIGSYELALYFFNGFYKEPRGILDPVREGFFYPRLNVYGFSARGPLLGGIGNMEMGFYDSRNDPTGRNGYVENPSIKYLIGYTRSITGDFTMGVQYMVDEILRYDSYRGSLGTMPARDEFRHLFTVRLVHLFLNQTLRMELFTFYSPSDRDVYLRPAINYRIMDSLRITIGANIFSGRFDYTEFGQLEGNNNIYTRLRYSF